MITLQKDFKNKLIEIMEMSRRINNNDKQKILNMMKEHVDEIDERYNNQDEHWAIETADLIVLSYELLLMENKVIDYVFSRCLPRFDIKLNRLLEDES